MDAYQCLWYQHIIKGEKIDLRKFRAHTFGHGITEDNLDKNNNINNNIFIHTK